MNTSELLEEMTETQSGITTFLGKMATIHPITTFFSEGSNPSRVAQRTMIVDGRKFLVQVVSLSENY